MGEARLSCFNSAFHVNERTAGERKARLFLCFAKQLRGLQEPAKVITGSEDEELLLILVPIGAEAAKHGGSVIQSVREHAEFHLGIRNNSAVMEDEIWQWHGFTSVDQSLTRTGSGTGWRST